MFAYNLNLKTVQYNILTNSFYSPSFNLYNTIKYKYDPHYGFLIALLPPISIPQADELQSVNHYVRL